MTWALVAISPLSEMTKPYAAAPAAEKAAKAASGEDRHDRDDAARVTVVDDAGIEVRRVSGVLDDFDARSGLGLGRSRRSTRAAG